MRMIRAIVQLFGRFNYMTVVHVVRRFGAGGFTSRWLGARTCGHSGPSFMT